jgi:hypothetical protein
MFGTYPGAPAQLWFNGEQLSDHEVQRLMMGLGGPVPPGRYWYDHQSGLWGPEGYPTQGQLPAGLELGGELAREASQGNTGVLVNGRDLPPQELAPLQALVGALPRGEYWLDALGNLGAQGGPPRVNLRQLTQAAAAAPTWAPAPYAAPSTQHWAPQAPQSWPQPPQAPPWYGWRQG